MSEQLEELLTVREFSKRANISRETGRRWAAARIIPSLKIARTLRIPWKRAMAALEKRMALETTAAEEPVTAKEEIPA